MNLKRTYLFSLLFLLSTSTLFGQITFTKDTESRTVIPCAEIQMSYAIDNQGGALSGVTLTDVLHPDLTITQINIPTSYGGTVVSGVGMNQLGLNNLSIPTGKDSIVVTLSVSSTALAGGIVSSGSLITPGLILSDDPQTASANDATGVTVINEGSTIFAEDTLYRCFEKTFTPQTYNLNYGFSTSYLWHDGDTNSSKILAGAGVYYVDIISSCATYRDTIVFYERPEILLTLSDTIVPSCNGVEDASITINASQGDMPYSYQWTDPGNQSTAIATGLAGGSVYYVFVTDDNLCTNSASIQIPVTTEIIPNVSNTDPICNGLPSGTALASPQGGTPGAGYTYMWSNGATTANNDNILAGVYTVTVMDANSCTTTQSTELDNPTEITFVMDFEQAVCQYERSSAKITNVFDATLPYNYAWDANASVIDSAGGYTPGTYTVTLTDNLGCPKTSAFTFDIPVSDIDAAVTTVEQVKCENANDGRIHVAASNGVGPYQYAFTDAQIFLIDSVSPPLAPGDYPTFVRDVEGCIDTLAGLTTITEADALALSIMAPLDTVPVGDSIQLFPLLTREGVVVSNTNADYIFEWRQSISQPSLLCFDCPEPWIAPDEEAVYTLLVTDTAGNNCTVEADVEIAVSKIKLPFLPTAFTPNGDGNNDVFIVRGNPGTYVEEFRVFDRWGQLLFMSGDFDVSSPDITMDGWDGTYTGTPVMPGVYNWFAQLVYPNGDLVLIKGDVTVLR